MEIIVSLVQLLHIVFLFAVFFVGYFMQLHLISDDFKYWPSGYCGILLITVIQLSLIIISTVLMLWLVPWK